MGDIDKWIEKQEFETTEDIEIPDKLIGQVIGQDEAVNVIRKAAQQKRHVILIGDPGTGKSMLAQSMTEFLSPEELEDMMVFPNKEDSNEPKIKTVPDGTGKSIVDQYKKNAEKSKMEKQKGMKLILGMIIALGIIIFILTMDAMALFMAIIAAAFIFIAFNMTLMNKDEKVMVPKLLISHKAKDKPPFIDATGTISGALLGDVRHDPFQSGGLETPAHQRVESGAIHKAHKGVLFIDEMNILRLESQQSLLTALQEKKFSITGQSERSAGAMVKTEPVPCDFILIAAGNLDAVERMHPALRSRIRGYGYEIYMNSVVDDTEDNRKKFVQLVAQEIKKDGKIPPFNKSAVAEIIKESQKRSGRKDKLTLRLREIGGFIRVAGDIAIENKDAIVTAEHVKQAKKFARPLEQQVTDKMIEHKKDYEIFQNEGEAVGTVNGLAVFSAGSGMAEYSGMVLPIVAEITPAQRKSQSRVIATGKLGEIAKEAVQNVTAIIKKYTNEDISDKDIHIQFIGTYDGVEGDSASVSVATAVISALEDIPVDQTVALTGSLSVRGAVLPVGGVTAKVEAALASGFKKVIVPESNFKDVILDEKQREKIEIISVKTLKEVLEHALITKNNNNDLLQKLTYIIPTIPLPKPIITKG